MAVLDRTDFPPLGLILENSVLVPLRAQKKLVDSALLDHLLVDCQLEEHFSALREAIKRNYRLPAITKNKKKIYLF